MSELAIRRVVVACDAVCELGPAIETATRLAAHWHASLHGVFLEDPGLRLAAGLPFVQQITLLPAGPESFELAEIEGQFRSIARRAERTLAEAAARFGLDWSFSLKRQTSFETGLGGTEADLLVLQAQARPFAGQFRLPSRWAKLLYQARHPVLLLHGERPAGGSVVLLLDPTTPAAPKSLAAATEMAALNRRPLIVLTKELADPAEIRRAVAAVSEAVSAKSRV